MGQKICKVPFRNLEILPEVSSCCCWVKNENKLKRDSGDTHQELSQYWNSDQLKRVRKSVLDKTYEECNSYCPHVQDGDYFAEEFSDEEIKDIRDNGYNIPYDWIRTALLSYDMTCNLSCPSCRTEVIFEKDKKEEFERIWSEVERIGSGITTLFTDGSGDVFFSPFMFDKVKNFPEDKFESLETFEIITNGIFATRERFYQISPYLLKRLKAVLVSVDAATRDTYSSVRRGSNWDTLRKNISFLSEEKLSRNFNFQFSFVIQKKNYREILQFLDFAEEYGADCVAFSEIRNWASMSKEEYLEAAVHLRSHPDHEEYLSIIRDSRLKSARYEGDFLADWGSGAN